MNNKLPETVIAEYEACRNVIDRRVSIQITLMGFVFTIAAGSLLYFNKLMHLKDWVWLLPLIFTMLLFIFIREDIMIFHHVEYIEKYLNPRIKKSIGADSLFLLEKHLREVRFSGKNSLLLRLLSGIRYLLFLIPISFWTINILLAEDFPCFVYLIIIISNAVFIPILGWALVYIYELAKRNENKYGKC